MTSRPVPAAWRLFTRWCWATGRTATAPTVDDLAQFVMDAPASPATTRRRLSVVLRELRDQGHLLTNPLTKPAPVQSPIRVGDGWLTYSETIRAVPRDGWPAGFTGRRDAFLLTLLGTLRFTRKEAITLEPADVTTYGWPQIRGRNVPFTPDPDTCPACTVALWLTALAAWETGGRESVQSELAFGQADHGCASDVNDSWRATAVLLPAIDRHGWLGRYPLTVRSVSRIVADRQSQPSVPADLPPRELSASFGKRPQPDPDLDRRLDDLDAAIDAVLARTRAVLKEVGVPKASTR